MTDFAGPFAFVGTAADCAPFPAGSNIVTAAWLRGMGLPDNDGLNTQPADTAIGGTNPNKSDPHFGLLLSKNGPTNDSSAPGAAIKGFRSLTATITLAPAYRNSGPSG